MANQHDYTDEYRLDAVKYYLDSGKDFLESAKDLGISHDSLRRWVKKFKGDIGEQSRHRYPKILTWDVECAPMTLEHMTYDLTSYIKRHPIDHIKRDWWMLGAAWKFLGEKKIGCISVNPKNPTNDEEVIHVIHDVLSSADILVGHNSDAFDYKKFNARAITYGLPPIAPKQSIDTLKIARQNFKFSSNTLRYIAQILGVDAKDESPDWQKCCLGDENELRYMRKYNRQDVIVTEKVYLKLRPYAKNHPNLNTYLNLQDDQGQPIPACKACGSVEMLRSDSHIHTNATKYRAYQCASCGSWNKHIKSLVKTVAR